MRGLWVAGGRVELRSDLPRPAPTTGECRVRVLRAGVCATDLALARGYMGFEGVPGHEFVGEALEGPLAGRRVAGEINAACGRCASCHAGLARHCPRRSVLGILGRPGAFAEELSLPEVNLHALPDELSTDAATFVEPLAAALEILEQVPVVAGERALVLGDGRLGLLCAQVLAGAGLEVEIEGRHPERARLLPKACRWTAAEVGGRYPLVVEATGSPAGLARAIERASPRGRIVLKTTSERASEVDLAPVVIDELTLVGSRCGPFEPAIAALAGGAVSVEAMIEGRFPLERGAEAFAAAARPGTLKILIEP